MNKLITYLSLLLLFLSSCDEEDTSNTTYIRPYKIEGADPMSETVEIRDGKLYIGGYTTDARPVAYVESNTIRKDTKKGQIIAEIKGNQVFGKTAKGTDFTATIDGTNIVNGSTKYGYRIGYVKHSVNDAPGISDGALGAVYFYYFAGMEFSDKNYTYILNVGTQNAYAYIENGELFFIDNYSKSVQAYLQGDTVYRKKEIIAIKKGNQIIEPISKGIIATVENNKVIRENSGKKETIAIIDGDEPAAGALAVAALIINSDIRIISKITNNHEGITKALVYLESVLIKEDSKDGKPSVILDGNNIIRGDSKNGETIAVLKGNQVIKGNSQDGKVIAEINADKIIHFTASGRQLTIGHVFSFESIKAGALGAAWFLLIDMPNDPTWITNESDISTKAIIYEDKIYKGGSKDTEPLAFVAENKIIKGSSENGPVLAVISGNKVVKNDQIIAEINDNQIIEITASGKKKIRGHFHGNESIQRGALGAVYLLLLENNSSGGNSSGGSSTTTEYTYIREGSSGMGPNVATVYNNKLYKESPIYSVAKAVLDGNNIKAGNSTNGTTIAYISGNRVVQRGTTIAVIDGDKIREGSSGYGKTIGTIDGKGGVNAGALGAVYLLLLK